MHLQHGNYMDACESLKIAYEYFRKTKGEKSPATLISLKSLAEALYETGRHKEGIDLLRLGLSQSETIPDTEKTDDDFEAYKHLLFIQAVGYLQIQDFEAALKTSERGLQLHPREKPAFKVSTGDTRPKVLMFTLQIGTIHCLKGNKREGQEYLKNAMEYFDDLPENASSVIETVVGFAEEIIKKEDLESADILLKPAMRKIKAVAKTPEGLAQVYPSADVVTEIYRKTNRKAIARDFLNEFLEALPKNSPITFAYRAPVERKLRSLND